MATFLTMYKDKNDAQNNVNALLPAPSIRVPKQTASTMVNSGRSSDGGLCSVGARQGFGED